MINYLKEEWPLILGVFIFCLFVYILLHATTTSLYFFFYEDLVEQTIMKMEGKSLR